MVAIITLWLRNVIYDLSLPSRNLKKGNTMQPKGTTIKKVSHTVMSDCKCKDCKEPIKQNLISKKPNAERCYKCHKLYHDRPNAVSA